MATKQSNDGAPSLAQFKSQFHGGARPYLWKMSLTFPKGATGTETRGDAGTGTVGSNVVIDDNSQKLAFDVEKISIPGMKLNPIEAAYMGRKVKYAGDRTDFEDITITVKNDKDWAVRQSFEQWMAFMNGNRENVGSDELSEYAVDIQITQLDRKGREIVTYTLIDAFPNSVGNMELNYENGNAMEKFDVTFSYQWWEREEAGII